MKINQRYSAQLANQRAKDNAYEAALRQEAYALAQQQKRKMQAWFQKYDSDASGVLESAELQQMLHELYPEEPPPSEDLCQTLIAMCVGSEGRRQGIRLEEVLATSTRFHDYVKRKAEIDSAFARFDQDGNGLVELEELESAMRGLVPSRQSPCEADVAFIYDACGLKLGMPIPVTAMPALMPALGEWAKLATAASNATTTRVVDGTPPAPAARRTSTACAIL